MENSYSIHDLLGQLEDLMSEATRVPFGKKSMVDIDRMNEVVQDIRMALPPEIKQAQNIVSD